ncbi:hypothetical protein [Burkholderia aenigmatica]|uniref:hypothetical protein n=1 Tax=Burkholderia aenigmatica TaxID=2015348 RepID=UPI002656B129|nr:hypothetical protein [Burkholderia aenigmatica]MDN7879251.1 hypothetical protein [Burkholderia aenigmatica]
MTDSEKYQGRIGLIALGLALVVAFIAFWQQIYQGHPLTLLGIEQRLSLKILTYHYSNRLDRDISNDALLAGRGFVYFLAFICFGAVGASIGLARRSLRPYMITYLAATSIFMLCIFYFSQTMAYYTFG